jgi:hypothetical protein
MVLGSADCQSPEFPHRRDTPLYPQSRLWPKSARHRQLLVPGAIGSPAVDSVAVSRWAPRPATARHEAGDVIRVSNGATGRHSGRGPAHDGGLHQPVRTAEQTVDAPSKARQDQNSVWYLSVIFLRISAVFSSSRVKTAIWFDLSTAVSCFRITEVDRETLGPPP